MAFTAYERVFVAIQLESCPTAKAFAILDCILRFIEESLGLFKKLKKKKKMIQRPRANLHRN